MDNFKILYTIYICNYMENVPVSFSGAVIITDQKQLGKEKFVWVTGYSHPLGTSRQEQKAGAWRQELK